jgi:hypothetical protein
VSGFGITATFAPGASPDQLIVLGNWPNGQGCHPPTGTLAKTFGIQECNVDYTGCTSVSGNYAKQSRRQRRKKIKGQVVSYSAFQPLEPTRTLTKYDLRTAQNKLVTITTNTTAADAACMSTTRTTAPRPPPTLSCCQAAATQHAYLQNIPAHRVTSPRQPANRSLATGVGRWSGVRGDRAPAPLPVVLWRGWCRTCRQRPSPGGIPPCASRSNGPIHRLRRVSSNGTFTESSGQLSTPGGASLRSEHRRQV